MAVIYYSLKSHPKNQEHDLPDQGHIGMNIFHVWEGGLKQIVVVESIAEASKLRANLKP